jgi:apolipoprotein D and lipocalin family protein
MPKVLYLESCCVVLGVYLAKEENNALQVVPHVDLQKYLGKWYEVAHLPVKFEDGCSEITATYTLLKDGNVGVLNECLKNGKGKASKGKAKVVDKNTGAKLKVTFFWPFYGDYWIINLGTNYDYSVVGTPNRKYLWILNRTPQMDKTLYAQFVEFAKSKGFDTEKIINTAHGQK